MCSNSGQHSFHAITTEGAGTGGTLWAWGNNQDSSLGTNNKTNYSSPVQIGSDTDWDICQDGQTDAQAIKTNGQLYKWGQNNQGQVGDGSNTDRSSPVQIGDHDSWDQVIGGFMFTIAVR